MNKYDLNSGIEKIFELLEKVKKPGIVGIYGHANAGKTYLRTKLYEKTAEMGLKFNGGMPENERAYNQNGESDYIFLEDYVIPFRKDSIKFASKPIDITVLIKNDSICNEEDNSAINHHIRKNLYDIVINNPDSKIK